MRHLFKKSCAFISVSGLMVFFLGFVAPLAVGRADNISDAKTKVDMARTEIEKINALYNYARALNRLGATREEMLKAREAVSQSLTLIAKLENAGQVLEPQSQFHYYAGVLALQTDDYVAAIRFFDTAERKKFVQEGIALGGKGALLFRVRAEAKWKNYDYAGALTDYNRAIELESAKSDYASRSRLHFDMGNIDAARADWGKGDKFDRDEQSDVLDIARERALLDGVSAQPIEDFPFDAALLPFNIAIMQNPRAAQPLLERAAYLIRRGVGGSGGRKKEIAKAQRDINYVLLLEPTSSKAFHLRALALWRLAVLNRTLQDAANTEPIVAAFNRALRNAENVAAIRLDIGDFWGARAQALPRDEASREERQKLLANAIFNYSQILIEQPQNSLPRARRIRLEQLNERPDSHMLLTDSEAIARDGLMALPGSIDEAEAQQLRYEAETARAQALLQNGELTAAQKTLDSALQRDPDANNLRLRGQIYVLRGRYDEAIADLERSLLDQRGNAQSWWWLGLAQDGKGNVVRAKSAFDNAIRIDASLARLTDGTRYAAHNPTDKSLVMPPVMSDLRPSGTPFEHKEAGNALMQKKDEAGALAEFSLALRLDPNYADALNNRASVYIGQGKLDLALADINRALQIEPTHRVAWLTRARIYNAQGERKLALSDLDNAVRYADTDVRRFTVLIDRAYLHLRLADKASARSDMDTAEKLSGTDTERLKQIAELRALLEK